MTRVYENEASAAFFKRYITILGIIRQEPSLIALQEILGAHLAKIPFENISKLYYSGGNGRVYFPDADQYLDGIEKFRFGGTCYTNNYYLNVLLNYLGYEIILCGADMNKPDVHVVSIVSLNGREYIVDVGYAAPFHVPLPRDIDDDFELGMGKMMYRIKPRDSIGRTRVERYYDGKLLHGYTVKPTARRIDFFGPAIEDSFSEQATFMNNFFLVKYENGQLIRLENLKYSKIEKNVESLTLLKDKSEASAVIEREFGVPSQVCLKALSHIGNPGEFRG